MAAEQERSHLVAEQERSHLVAEQERSHLVDMMMAAGEEAGQLQRHQNTLHRECMLMRAEQKRLEGEVQRLQEQQEVAMATLLEMSPRKTALEQEAQRLRTLLFPAPLVLPLPLKPMKD